LLSQMLSFVWPLISMVGRWLKGIYSRRFEWTFYCKTS
jgi:hypothetical protein